MFSKHDREALNRNKIRLDNEQDVCVKLEKWRDLESSNMLLVHCINSFWFNSSEFFHSKAEDVLRKWDVFSASLITYGVKYGGINGRNKYTGMYSEVGIVLDVPPQNILGTHCRDVYFPAHIGTKMHGKDLLDPWKSSKNSWKLADTIFSGKGKGVIFNSAVVGRSEWPCNEGKAYNVIEAPLDILFKSNRENHNEILIVGKPGVSLHHGLPPTQEIKVKAIIVGERYHSDWVKDPKFTDIKRTHDMNSAIEKLMEVNSKLNVIRL